MNDFFEKFSKVVFTLSVSFSILVVALAYGMHLLVAY